MSDAKMQNAGSALGPGNSSVVPTSASRNRLAYFPITAKAAMEVKSKPTFPKSSFLDDTSPDETTITPTTILGWNKFVSSPVSSFFFFAERYVSAASKAAKATSSCATLRHIEASSAFGGSSLPNFARS
eukprot:CAMPEP_0182611852 /NCGR_PEP_ID=MMETSP1330-20130603/15763_1 /TAXON_ID=464278 /ORGANISM="Picochlorum sp., Strain RCC944" /LENGTH=128 /DNA_ID=CAMNT_0024831305 /DNA_START=102 /DNA_END=488 /DNA_ORIENTATION=-